MIDVASGETHTDGIARDAIEIPPVSLPSFVLERAAKLGTKPALIDAGSGRTLTYEALAGGVERAAAGLAARGFEKGDVCCLYSPNCPEYAIVFHAVATLGGIVTTASPLATVEELVRQLGDTNARYLLTVGPFAAQALEAAERTVVEEVFVLGKIDDDSAVEDEGEVRDGNENGNERSDSAHIPVTPFEALVVNEGSVPEVAIDPREDIAVLPYSSGTTGLPKGVRLTHYNMVANLAQVGRLEPKLVTGKDTLIAVLPFFHIMGMQVVMNLALREGATVVTMARFELAAFLETLEAHAVTVAIVVPPIVLAPARHSIVKEYDLSALDAVGSGAAPLSADLARECAERLDCLVNQGYGLTEASAVVHLSPRDPERIKTGTVGRPIPGTECRIVDLDTGAELEAGEEGEVLVRGPQVMAGYHNRPEATARTIDEDGWLHTGDVGCVDEDGYLTVVDRIKELIKYKGYQVAPAELEGVLLGHPAVADAAVVPRPDEDAGEIPVAYVVLSESAATSEGSETDATHTTDVADEIIAFVAKRVAPHKRVRAIEVIDAVPKSVSGKVLRRDLIERERARRGE